MKLTVYFDADGKPLHGIYRFPDRKTGRMPTLCGMLAPQGWTPKERHYFEASGVIFRCNRCQLVWTSLQLMMQEEARAFPKEADDEADGDGHDTHPRERAHSRQAEGGSRATAAPAEGGEPSDGPSNPWDGVDSRRDAAIPPDGRTPKPDAAGDKPGKAKGKSRKGQG